MEARGVIFAEGWLDDSVGLGILAGRLLEEDTAEKRREFQDKLKAILERHDCGLRKYSGLTRGGPFPRKEHAPGERENFIGVVLSDPEFAPEVARWAARQVAYDCLMKTPKKMWCICPELERSVEPFSSQGKETTGSWKGREVDRKAGQDVPMGGCICMLDGEDIPMIVDHLIVTESS